jgi:hypothetical protein
MSPHLRLPRRSYVSLPATGARRSEYSPQIVPKRRSGSRGANISAPRSAGTICGNIVGYAVTADWRVGIGRQENPEPAFGTPTPGGTSTTSALRVNMIANHLTRDYDEI